MKTANSFLRIHGSDGGERAVLLRVLAGLGLLLAATLLVGCTSMDMGAMGEGASKTSGSMRETSDNGLFQVTVRSEEDPIPLNAIHTWILHVETRKGDTVNDATITVDGGMPAHGHGLPTAPQVTENMGNGDYRVEGLKFHMQGDWVVTFAISAGGEQDTVTLEFGL